MLVMDWLQPLEACRQYHTTCLYFKYAWRKEEGLIQKHLAQTPQGINEKDVLDLRTAGMAGIRLQLILPTIAGRPSMLALTIFVNYHVQ